MDIYLVKLYAMDFGILWSWNISYNFGVFRFSLNFAMSSFSVHEVQKIGIDNLFEILMWKLCKSFVTRKCAFSQGLLEFIWTEGCSGQSSNPGPALTILVL